MSLTQSETLFLGVLEDAANVVLRALCTARPRYLSYSTVSPTSLAVTNIPLAGIYLTIDAAMPRVDFHPHETAWPGSPLSLGEFGVSADPVSIDLGIAAFTAGLAVRGHAAMMPISAGYSIVLTATGIEVVNVSSPILAPLIPIANALLQQALTFLPPFVLPLPPLSIGPIVPAIAPLIDTDQFALRGHF